MLATTISAARSPSTSAAIKKSKLRFQSPAGPLSGVGDIQTGTKPASFHLSSPVHRSPLFAMTTSSARSPSTSAATNRSHARFQSPAGPLSGLGDIQIGTRAEPFHFRTPVHRSSLLAITTSAAPSASTSAEINRSFPRSQSPAGPCSTLDDVHAGESAEPFHLSIPAQKFPLSATTTSTFPFPSRSAVTKSLGPAQPKLGPCSHVPGFSGESGGVYTAVLPLAPMANTRPLGSRIAGPISATNPEHG